MTQHGIVQGDALQRLGSAGYIVGALLIAIGGFLLPRAANPSNLQEMLKPLGEQEVLTQVCVLLITSGYWAVMIGAAGVYRSITAGGASWARLGFYFIIVGTALWTVILSLDVDQASAVAKWLAAPTEGKEAAYSVVTTLTAIGRGIYAMSIMVYWLALVFLGIGMVRSAVYPRWLGWVGLIVGITGVPLGIIQTFTERSSTLTLMYVLLSFVTTLWFLAVGIWVARTAWSWRRAEKDVEPNQVFKLTKEAR
jgi:Domain of unknown function (DUF4386)